MYYEQKQPQQQNIYLENNVIPGLRESIQQINEITKYHNQNPAQNTEYSGTTFVCGDVNIKQPVLVEDIGLDNSRPEYIQDNVQGQLSNKLEESKNLETTQRKQLQADYSKPIGNVSTSITPGFTQHVKDKLKPTVGVMEPDTSISYSNLQDYITSTPTPIPLFVSSTQQPVLSTPGITNPIVTYQETTTPGITNPISTQQETTTPGMTNGPSPNVNPTNDFVSTQNVEFEITGTGYLDDNIRPYANIPSYVQSEVNAVPTIPSQQKSTPSSTNQSPKYNPNEFQLYGSSLDSQIKDPYQNTKEPTKPPKKTKPPQKKVLEQTQPPHIQEAPTEAPQTNTPLPSTQPPTQMKTITVQSPIDSKISGWSDWSPCILGSTERTRTQITIPPVNNGATIIPQIQVDNTYCPLDSKISGWSDWSSCVTGSTERTRTQITIPPRNNGATIIPKTETDNSYCSIDSTVAGWSDWSPCVIGSTTRTRTQVTVPPINNGRVIIPQTEIDNTYCPLDSTITGWSNWSPCVIGYTQRTRTQITIPPRNNGATIIPQTQIDNSYCPIDSTVVGWSNWSPCVIGSTTRTRTQITVPPVNNGRVIIPQTQIDNTYCPVDSIVSGWSDWSSCVTGSAQRTRTQITIPPRNNGATIIPRTQTDNSYCPVDCTYMIDDTKTTCDNNTWTKKYTVTQFKPLANDGKKCLFQGTEVIKNDQIVPSQDTCTINAAIPNLSSASRYAYTWTDSNITNAGTYSLTVSGQPNNLFNGTYYVTASNFYHYWIEAFPPSQPFSPEPTTDNYPYWTTNIGPYILNFMTRSDYPYGTADTTSYGIGHIADYIGPVTTQSNMGVLKGEWLQIQFPNAFTMQQYSILPSFLGHVPRRKDVFQMLNSWYLLGTNSTGFSQDPTNWTVIDTQTTQYKNISETKRYSVSSTPYNMYRIVITSMFNGRLDTNPNAACGQIQFYY